MSKANLIELPPPPPVRKRVGFDLAEMAMAFHLAKNRDCAVLQTWLGQTHPFSQMEEQVFEAFYSRANDQVDYWNEEELKIKGVGILFFLANIEERERVGVFYERALRGTVDNYLLAVVADCVVAAPTPFNTPAVPFFFLQEYKKGKGEKNDPEAQMLQAMLIAQAQNNDQKPVFGGFLIGSNWYFTTLIGRDYCVSKKFDATDKADLRQIVHALRELKHMILNR
jgi:hypothetical protein